MPKLTESHRTRLDGIVQQMADNGESDDAIKFVVSDYQSKYGLPDKPVSAEDFAPKSRDVSVGSMLWNAAKSVPAGIIGLGKTLTEDQQPEDAFAGPMAALMPLARSVVRGAKGEAQKALSAPSTSEAIGHGAAALLPLVGPAAAEAGEDIGSGDPVRIERGGGNAIGLVGSMVAPAIVAKVAPKIAPPLASIGEQLASKGKAIGASKAGKVGAELIKTVGLEGAAHMLGVPPGIVTATRIGAKVKDALDAVKAAAPEAANAGGKLVRDASGAPVKPPTIEQMLANSLAEIAKDKTPPTKVTTPPQPDLPAGYTPRATVPKPKAPPKPAAEPRAARNPRDVATMGPKGYFLRKPAAASAEEMPARAEAAPPGLEDLPVAWRSRTLQQIGGKHITTADMAQALNDEMSAAGVTPEEVIADVTKRRDLSPPLRMQLLAALNKTRQLKMAR